jgi:hypothetical protein
MQDWKVVEVIKGTSKLKYSGSNPEKAKAEYKAAAAMGTAGKLMLLDENGIPVEEFEAVANSGSITGLPIREIKVPFPPAFQEAAARARLSPPILKCMRRPEPEPVPEPAPTPPVVRWYGRMLARLRDEPVSMVTVTFAVVALAMLIFVISRLVVG